MNHRLLGLNLAVLLIAIACNNTHPDADVIIETDFGEIQIELFDDTPKHRDNFLKLANQGFFDSTTFHRVVKGFVIQGGDPLSRTDPNSDSVGMGGPGYKLPMEIRPNRVHIRGAVAAARRQDDLGVNSGSQFYIALGDTIPAIQIEQLKAEVKRTASEFKFASFLKARGNEYALGRLQKYYEQMQEAQATPDTLEQLRIFPRADRDKFGLFVDSLSNAFQVNMKATGDSIPDYTPGQIQAYMQTGGVPMLDFQYTVFGRVVEGMDVVDRINNVATDERERPALPVRMRVRVVER